VPVSRLASGAYVSVILLAGLSAAVPAAAAPSVVAALDTSRSLDVATLTEMKRTTAAALGALPGDTRVGVLAFDDTPRWVLREGTPAEAAKALDGLAPAGSFTLLDDALFTAARELAPGGVVLLLTDGRDENSATTVEDVARACEARGVRVVAVGAGKRLDERSMRRLAMLTGGGYVGALPGVRSESVAEALGRATSAPPPAAKQANASPGTSNEPAVDSKNEPGSRSNAGAKTALASSSSANDPPAAAAVAGATSTTTAATVSRSSRWWWLAVPLALVAIAVPVAIARGRARQRTTICKQCGREIPTGEDCPHCTEQEAERALQERLRSRNMTRLEETAELRLDAIDLDTKTTNLDSIEKTRVIADQSMLLVREPGESQRSFLLRSDGAFAVGRDPRSNTLILRDPALSAHHFKVVPDDGWFYVVDLDSTNGTYLNRHRVRAHKLLSGDVIQAGQVELEFRSFLGQLS
jgi:FHA domain-containing protein/von Willebrand factor type A domain-containing protein